MNIDRLLKECVCEVLREDLTSPSRPQNNYVVQYAISGLEQIPDSKHPTQQEAWKAARDFIQSYASRDAGEKMIKTERGYAIKHAGGGWVGVATISKTDQLREDSKIPNPGKLTTKERILIGKEFAKVGLDGNGRFEKKEYGLRAVTNVLAKLGFNLDMVTADIIMGDQGSRNLLFRRTNIPGQDPFTEQPEISNSRIAFSWTLLSPNKFEVLAYAS